MQANDEISGKKGRKIQVASSLASAVFFMYCCFVLLLTYITMMLDYVDDRGSY